MNDRIALALGRMRTASKDVNGATERYLKMQQDRKALTSRLDKMEDAVLSTPTGEGRLELAKMYRESAGMLDDMRDAASDITYALGDLSNRMRDYASAFEEEGG